MKLTPGAFLLCNKGLVKLTPGVNITNILQAAFLPLSFCQKITNTNCKYRKAVKTLLYKKDARKMLVKLTSYHIFYHRHRHAKDGVSLLVA